MIEIFFQSFVTLGLLRTEANAIHVSSIININLYKWSVLFAAMYCSVFFFGNQLLRAMKDYHVYGIGSTAKLHELWVDCPCFSLPAFAVGFFSLSKRHESSIWILITDKSEVWSRGFVDTFWWMEERAARARELVIAVESIWIANQRVRPHVVQWSQQPRLDIFWSPFDWQKIKTQTTFCLIFARVQVSGTENR